MAKVWVELNNLEGQPVRIFRNYKIACQADLDDGSVLIRVEERWAVGHIRRQVFDRDRFRCVVCGEPGNWDELEMDERVARGTCVEVSKGEFRSGEVSVANCQTLCKSCHTGIGGKHDRNPQWTQ